MMQGHISRNGLVLLNQFNPMIPESNKVLQKTRHNDHRKNFCFMFDEECWERPQNDPAKKKTDFLLRFLRDVEEEVHLERLGDHLSAFDCGGVESEADGLITSPPHHPADPVTCWRCLGMRTPPTSL